MKFVKWVKDVICFLFNCMVHDKIKFESTDFIKIVMLNVTLQIFYGVIPAMIFASSNDNIQGAVNKIQEMLPQTGCKLYIYFFSPLLVMIVYYLYLKFKYFSIKYFLSSNFQPIFDLLAKIQIIKWVANKFIMELTKSIKKIYLIFIGIIIFYTIFLVEMEFYKEASHLMFVVIVLNYTLAYIELRTRYRVEQMKSNSLYAL